MTLLPFRAGRRVAYTLGALLVVPAFLTSAVTFAAPPGSTPDQVAKHDDKEYTIARTFKAKDVNHYKMSVTTSIDNPQFGNIDVVATMVYKETTKEVKDNGSAVLTSEFDSASVNVAGMDRDIASSLPTITTTVDKQGHVLDTKMEGGDPSVTQQMSMGALGNMGQQSFFPGKPIKVGDIWKIDSPAKDKKSAKVTGTATLIGTDTINGILTLKIKTVTDSEISMENPTKAGEMLNVKAHAEGVTNIDVATGKMVKMTMSSTGDSGALGKSKSDITVTLVPADDKTKEGAKPGDAKKSPDKADKPKE